MGRKRSGCISKDGLNRGAWTAEEDEILLHYVRVHGEGKWRNIPLKAGLNRCGKSCRLRWFNYLRPDIKRGNISPDEADLIIRLHRLLGNRWSLIAGRLPGRTDNEIKNYWNSYLGKRVETNPQSQSTSKVDSNDVVCTKVSNCSKLPPEPPLPHTSLVVDGSTHINLPTNNKMETKECDKEKESPSNSLLDFDLGNICLPDLLDSAGCSSSSMCNNFGEQYHYNREDYLWPAFMDQQLVCADFGSSSSNGVQDFDEIGLAYNNNFFYE